MKYQKSITAGGMTEYTKTFPARVKKYRELGRTFDRIDVRIKTPTKRDVYLLTDYKLKGIKNGYMTMRAKPDPKKGEIDVTLIKVFPSAKVRRGILKESKVAKEEVRKFKKAIGL